MEKKIDWFKFHKLGTEELFTMYMGRITFNYEKWEDNVCKRNGRYGKSYDLKEVASLMSDAMNPTAKDLYQALDKIDYREDTINQYRAEFENACDDLYYGYGYDFWRKHNNTIPADQEKLAVLIWHRAIEYMGSAD